MTASLINAAAAELLKRDDDDACVSGNDYNDENNGARISAVFVILFTSCFGAFFPLLSSRYSFIKMPSWCFFFAKFFGSGVIIATAFIHLLQPANENLSEECLGGVFVQYPMAFAICLIMIFVMFFMELVAYRWIEARTARMNTAAGITPVENAHGHSHFGEENLFVKHNHAKDDEKTQLQEYQEALDDVSEHAKAEAREGAELRVQKSHDSNLEAALAAHSDDVDEKEVADASYTADGKNTHDIEKLGLAEEALAKEQYAGNLLNVFILEFGIIFHSVFVGITLSCAGEEFVTLYIVIVFHQMFEGLGLGTRIALVEWPKEKRWTPWMLALAYGLTTPISIAIGIGVRKSYPAYSRRALITNGVFDSISSGILVYTGLIELMAHEFLFSDEFKGATGFKKMMIAYVIMCFGAGLMALLGKWA